MPAATRLGQFEEQSSLLPIAFGDDSRLPALAFEALSGDDPVRAFAYADRLCRITAVVDPLHLLLRGQALSRLGRADLAARDALAALEIEPRNLAACRLLMESGGHEEAFSAACVIADTAMGITPLLEHALRSLQAMGEPGWARTYWDAGELCGWAAWTPDTEAVLAIRTIESTREIPLRGDPDHPHAAIFGRAADIRVSVPEQPANAIVRVAGVPRGLSRRAAAAAPASPVRGTAGRGELTIVIPVYDDYAATRRCIESVIAHRPYIGTRVVIIDDESPDPAIGRYLDSLDVRGVDVLRNPINLGFVGAANRGIAVAGGGDVLLLNADTIVPARFVQRLRTAAYSAPDIGTVVPLSNNGEFVSLPQPFVANPFANSENPAAEVNALDRAAEIANGFSVVDLPSGIGFCLYITARCLADVPLLSEGWGRGYLEDADYCLRAAAHGWRNVCATGLFVGHHGSRSFKDEKRALVVSNGRRLAARFPDYRAACASFVSADPLRQARARVERRLSRSAPAHRLVVAGPRLASLARIRAQAISERGTPCLLMAVEPGGHTVSFHDADGKVPQSLQIALSDPDLSSYLRERDIDARELVGLEPLPRTLWERLTRARRPIDLFVASLRHADIVPNGREVAALALMAEGAFDHVQAADEIVAAALAKMGHTLPLATMPRFRSDAPAGKVAPAGASVLIVMPEPDGPSFLLVRELACRLRARGNPVPFVVFGRTLDDRALMSHGGVHIAGPVSPSETAELAELYNAGWIVLPDRFASSAPETIAAAQLALPTAYFALSDDKAGMDLRISPELNDVGAAVQITAWLEQQAGR